MRMFKAAAFQRGALSKFSLHLDASESGLLERRAAHHLIKCVGNLETFLDKQTTPRRVICMLKP